MLRRTRTAARRGGTRWWPPIGILLLLTGNALFAIAFTVYLALGASDDGIVARQLDPSREGNVATWYASFQWTVAAVLLAVYAWSPPPGRSRGLRLYVPPLACLGLSMDESASLHEWLGHYSDILLPNETRAGTFFWVTGIWMVIFVPVALLAGMVLGRLLADHLHNAARAARLFVTGGLLFVLGAGVLEIAANVVADERLMLFGLTIVEETSELMGSTLVVWGAWELLRAAGVRITRLSEPAPTP